MRRKIAWPKPFLCMIGLMIEYFFLVILFLILLIARLADVLHRYGSNRIVCQPGWYVPLPGWGPKAARRYLASNAACQRSPFRNNAFKIVSNFRIHATIATFFAFPTANNRW